jgi:hypothetical protein
LDFAAVTDHAEFFGEVQLCTDPDSEVYATRMCRLFRTGVFESVGQFVDVNRQAEPQRIAEICGEDGQACYDAAIPLWKRTQEMAEVAYDKTSACSFTALIGYEYTGTPDGNNFHRNIIFRNSHVPERATSYVDAPTDQELWAALTEECLEGVDGCDVLAIPHNSNLSAGRMFPSYMSGFENKDNAAAVATLRNAMEPLMEVFQHKGNSECFNGFPDVLGAVDELCNVEQPRTLGERPLFRGGSVTVEFCDGDEIGSRGFNAQGCISKRDFYRTVLLTGLQDEAEIGVNSYKIGVIASTDTHIGASGHTDESDWIGHLVLESTFDSRMRDRQSSPLGLTANPGGLAGVWAVENSRDAIFDALERREAFGTSGTRITPRLFGGWDFNANVCSAEDVPAAGYADGVPMGTDLPARTTAQAPKFLVLANQDPDAAQLQKLQIIKGWIDGDGQAHYDVIDVTGQENEAGEVNLQTGEWSGSGASSLCAVFEDENFDPALPSYYYMRAVEVPTFRWSWAQCVALPEDKRPEACTNNAPKTIQEMAWTSPIWYMP